MCTCVHVCMCVREMGWRRRKREGEFSLDELEGVSERSGEEDGVRPWEKILFFLKLHYGHMEQRGWWCHWKKVIDR